ncbi:MAG: hypothetical protein BHW12_03285 [Coprobacillus sp. 28_7]|nr:MAG: hypothetical protein BHW12_03285 [Coprobacillus sp. 28_7]
MLTWPNDTFYYCRLYAKEGTSNLIASFGTNFDTTKVKAQLIQNEQVTELKSETTKSVTMKTGTNKFTIRVISLADEKNYTDYNFTVTRAASSTATLKSATVKPYERQLNTVKKFYSILAKRSVTEGTLFRAQEDGMATSTTGFNVNENLIYETNDGYLEKDEASTINNLNINITIKENSNE